MLKALAMVGVTALVAIGGQRHADADASQGASSAVVMPATVAAGARVSVFDGNACAGKAGTATSAAFTTPVKLAPVADMVGGTARIRRGMTPGTYPVMLSCGNHVTATVTVAAAGTPGVQKSGVTAAGSATALPLPPDNKRVMTGFVTVAGLVALVGYAFRHRRFFIKNEEVS